MTVNLTKNKDAMLKAWEEIHDPNGKNNWVMYGYDGKSSDLKIVGQGEDGLEELTDDLNGGKILYAGLRITDPNTDLPKIVFINWQGEGVPGAVKGKCANHLRDITKLFFGVHVQINARSDDDVDEDAIIEKVKKSSGANYSFHKEAPKAFIPQGDIGTNYERQRPDQYIAQSNKDTFWAQSEKEEQGRKVEETKRLQEERIVESRARAEREKKEAARRDEWVRERSKSIEEQRKFSRDDQSQRKEEEKARYEATLKESEKDDDEFRRRSDSDRRKRLSEANQMIRKRQESFGDTSPRDTFEQKSAPPPPAPKKKAAVPPPTKGRLPPAPRQPSPEPEPEPARQPSPEPVREPSPEPVREPSPEPIREPSPVPARHPPPEPVREPSPEPVRQPSPEPVFQQEATKELPAEPTDQLYDNVDDMRKDQPATTASFGLTARALYDYQAADETEITFDPDDIITQIEKVDDGWWRGQGPDGRYGMFPANFVELVEEDSPAVPETPAPTHVEPEEIPEQPASDNGPCARALYDYQAADETEITFDPDDIIKQIEQIDEGWWRGEAPNGKFGLFPANYVELIQ